MPQHSITEQIRSRFAQSLPASAERRIVIWHDPDGEFAEEFEKLAADGALLEDSSERPVNCIEVRDGNTFEAKLNVCRLRRKDDFLLYRRRGRAQLDGDWLADVELYAEHFQADYLSLLVQDLDAQDTPEVRASLQQMKGYFGSKERVARFRRLMPRPSSASDVVCGVVAALLEARDASVAGIVQAYVVKIEDLDYDADAVSSLAATLEKYGAEEPFERLLAAAIGFEGDVKDVRACAAHLLVSALSVTLPESLMAGLEAWTSPGSAQICLSVVREWMQSGSEDEILDLYDICRQVESELHLPQRFAKASIEQLMGSDVFPSIDEAILADLMRSLSEGSDRREEAKRAVQTRREMGWRSVMQPYYDCVFFAAEMQDFQRAHADSFGAASPEAIWDSYVGEWWRMDAAYRSFVKAFAQCIANGLPALDDVVRMLADWVDRVYANWFLAKSNAAWVSASKRSWESRGYVEGVAPQRRFFDDVVVTELNKSKRVMVIVSDAMRYEVAQQLAQELERRTRGVASVSAMQSVFPSVTRFGMAALLPHRRLQFSEATGEVSVDDMPTKSLADRQSVLCRRMPESAAIRYADLLGMTRAERKAFAADLRLMYVYHNVIDAAGHGETSGQSVFDACDDAVDNVVALVRAAVNDMGVGRVVITSDHGFLYTRQEIPEVDQASREEVSGTVEKVERRFVIADPDATSGVFVNMNMEDVDGGVSTWWAPRDCVRIKCPGSKNYVHGGVSLQELCVPVVRFRNLKAGSKEFVEQERVQIQLLSTRRRITSTVFFLDLYQKDRVAGKVLPCDYVLAFTDSSGNEVSDRCIVHADNASENDADRKIKVRFALKPGRKFDSAAPYYLTVRDNHSGQTCWTEEFQIEISFAPEFDFGF